MSCHLILYSVASCHCCPVYKHVLGGKLGMDQLGLWIKWKMTFNFLMLNNSVKIKLMLSQLSIIIVHCSGSLCLVSCQWSAGGEENSERWWVWFRGTAYSFHTPAPLRWPLPCHIAETGRRWVMHACVRVWCYNYWWWLLGILRSL